MIVHEANTTADSMDEKLLGRYVSDSSLPDFERETDSQSMKILD